MKTLDELRDLAIRWALDYISHHQAQSRVNLDGIGSGLATAQRFEEESKRALDDALRELIADAEAYRHERDHTRARLDIAVKHLAAIHMRLYPEPFVHKETGTEYRFNPPNPHLYLQELSDQIRSIPDTLEASRKG